MRISHPTCTLTHAQRASREYCDPLHVLNRMLAGSGLAPRPVVTSFATEPMLGWMDDQNSTIVLQIITGGPCYCRSPYHFRKPPQGQHACKSSKRSRAAAIPALCASLSLRPLLTNRRRGILRTYIPSSYPRATVRCARDAENDPKPRLWRAAKNGSPRWGK